ncbi:MAG TPA: DUF1905 domain-containing protein [Cyclobacteriaceae bacterium]|nr:DUF1905 domain-containing protein [Cyclobacteriaceae bacterium]
MKHTFKAKIYKTGINWCVDVPRKITERMRPTKGYIRIKGTINGARFMKSLVPVKNSPYRLFVNRQMMKTGKTALGKVATFVIAQDQAHARKIPLPPPFAAQLQANGLLSAFTNLPPSRKKDILLYLNNIKTPPVLLRNIEKVVMQLKRKLEEFAKTKDHSN